MTFLEIFILLIILICLGIFMLMYLDGYFKYEETIIEKNKYKRTTVNPFISAGTEEYIYRIIIKREYLNGRIKFITKEIKA
jgi:hypothetical protein